MVVVVPEWECPTCSCGEFSSNKLWKLNEKYWRWRSVVYYLSQKFTTSGTSKSM
jgi:hypothetical protein